MIDLHVHSTASDGTFAPAALAEQGRPFAMMALTDHDNMAGVASFLAAGAAHGTVRLSGIELSVDPGAGYGIFHLLGLGLDPDHPAMTAFLARILSGRRERNRCIIARFARLGIAIVPEELATYANGEIVARPHFARYLVDRGLAHDVKSAFDTYLAHAAPPETSCYVPRHRPDPGEAIDVIHAAHGVAVMAHPKYWTDDDGLLRTGLAALKERGLDGLEAVYAANEISQTIRHLRVAEELGLAVTAGSDFHGANKPTVPLGVFVADDVAFLRPLEAALAHRGASAGVRRA